MGWSDVAEKAIEFLEKPNALGAAVIIAVLIFLAYTVPIGTMVWMNIDGTNRIVTAIHDLKATVEATQRVAIKPLRQGVN